MLLKMDLKEKINIVKEILFKMYPENKTELKYENPYQLLVAVMMSAQTTDKQVNKANEKFFRVLKKPEDAIKLWVEWIKKYIKSIGFYNNKAKNIYETSKILLEKYNWEIPKTLEELTALPWVGIKTAKVVMAVLYDAPYLPVDTHVHRVLNRLGIVNTKTPLETDKVAAKVLDKDATGKLHHSLIFFWRYHCTARNPKCNECPLQKVCEYYSLNSEEG